MAAGEAGRATGATPLVALEAVALDTETTGLDVARDRIVQLGAVGFGGGRVLAGAPFETLVRPGVAIPAKATAIHGIGDADVAAAPPFGEAWAAFERFRKGRVVLGYSVGFDLSIAEREARLAGIAWQRPRALCVRLLAAALGPSLPDQSLDTIAAWLGVAVAGRHSAAGDALAAAEIFAALLPRLKEKGIGTLAEAERACLGQTALLEGEHRAGWSEAVRPPDAAERTAYGALDSFLYRTKVAAVMTPAPLVVAPGETVAAVVALMVARRISSVFVSEGAPAGAPVEDYGIVTERDVMRRIAADGAAALAGPVGPAATRPLASVRAQAFVYRAVSRMDRLGIRHLAVRDEAGRLAGVVSARDLLRLRAGRALRFGDAIEAAGSGAEMAAVWTDLPAVAAGLLAEDIDAGIVAEIVSEELRVATRRAAVLAEQALAAEGMGPAPCPYAVLVLGSAGRGESLLAADQDNAIVFAEGEPDGAADRWFAALGSRLAATLDTAGIPLCKGGVMAKNEAWRGSLATWEARVRDWVTRSTPDDLLNVDIFFDLAPVHGDAGLAASLLTGARAAARDNVPFLKLLGERISGGSPFQLLGGLRTEGGRIDLKKATLFPIVAAARTLAIRHGVAAPSTRGRLEGLLSADVGGRADLERLAGGHGFVLGLMLAQQSRDLHAGEPVSNRVALAGLSAPQHARLKEVLREVQSIPTLLRDLMFG